MADYRARHLAERQNDRLSDAECDQILSAEDNNATANGECDQVLSADLLTIRGLEERAHWSRAFAATFDVSDGDNTLEEDARRAGMGADVALNEYKKRFGGEKDD